MRTFQPRTLPNICKAFRCKFGLVVRQLLSVQRMTLPTSTLLSRTSLLLKRFAAPWDFKFKFYRAAENVKSKAKRRWKT